MTKKENLDWITESIIGAAIEVHRALGPGLLGGCSKFFYYTPRESAYEACLAFELAVARSRCGTTEDTPCGVSGGETGLWLPPGPPCRGKGDRGDQGR
jgi:hypothetical protein